MKKLIQIVLFISIAFVSITVAVETETVATVDGRVITNIDVFKERSKSIVGTYCGTGCMASVLRRIIDPILFEQYAKRENRQVTEQEILEVIEQQGRKKGFVTAEEYFKENRGKGDKSIKDWQAYKAHQKGMLAIRLVKHFSPNVSDITEEDIQEYVEHYKETTFYPMGHREGVEFRSILVRTDIINKDKSLLKELEKIKQRINKNETFKGVVEEYRNREEFTIGDIPFGSSTRDLEISKIKKQGLDALIPWSSLKGKAVMVSFADSAQGVIIVDDYVPDTRMEIEDAVRDKELRKEVIAKAKGHKWGKEKRRLLKKLRTEDIKYADNPKKIYQKLAESYELWWIETFKDKPDFQQRLERLRDSKAKYLEREEKKRRKKYTKRKRRKKRKTVYKKKKRKKRRKTTKRKRTRKKTNL